MFTGIVTDIGEIRQPDANGAGPVASLAHRMPLRPLNHRGRASIACNGVCLTVVASGWRKAKPGSTSTPRRRRWA